MVVIFATGAIPLVVERLKAVWRWWESGNYVDQWAYRLGSVERMQI
jgi:hypothetical protein